MSAKLVETMARMPQARKRPRRVLARGTGAEVVADEQDLAACVVRLVDERDGGTRRAPSGVKRQSKKRASARFALSVILRKRAGQIWSVSMFARGIAITRLVVVTNGFGHVSGPPRHEVGGGDPAGCVGRSRRR